ncbi:hypothetical protein HYC85_017492 [Camellia sinensis]|uniref:Uncharacterized protein n=1 Tax=Camellia sinensis TaxID=4442 RepID=A0A7J7GTA2_CAMSI|nr:hypothetical protein HYC85_017492 [Camellia sinensis]
MELRNVSFHMEVSPAHFHKKLDSGDKENKFSIFVHSRPGFLFNKATTRSAYFLNRQKNVKLFRFKSIGCVSVYSVKCLVDWGEASMILAERILLKHALLDPFNERFLFLSHSCIPLYNFSYTYDYIMSTPTSFVDSFADTKEGRYNPKMHPVIPVHNWRKGSQVHGLGNGKGVPYVRATLLPSLRDRHSKLHQTLNSTCRGRPLSKVAITLAGYSLCNLVAAVVVSRSKFRRQDRRY